MERHSGLNNWTNENTMPKEISPHYEVMGTGEIAIVFIHYFGGDAGSWRWLAKRLKRKYTCILLNLPGFGDTTPLKEPSIYGFSKYINTCIEYLNLDDYILCGHSMGAKLALYATKLMTGIKPSKLVLIAPSPPTVEDMDEDEKKRMLIHPDRNEAVETVKGATRRKLGEKRFQYAVNSQLRIEDATWDWWLQVGMKNNIASRISDLKIPRSSSFPSKIL